jgi:hypothetical protein
MSEEVAAALHYRTDEYFNILILARNEKTSLSDNCLISSSLLPNLHTGIVRRKAAYGVLQIE